MKMTCEFQKYQTWGSHHCSHSKRDKDYFICDGLVLDCSHREMMRNGCDIARVYFKLNVKSIHLNTVKACGYIDGCKRKCKGDFLECTEKGVREWAERYKKEFKRVVNE